jgi:hypothetical protein
MVKKFASALAGITRDQVSGSSMGVGIASLAAGVGIVAGVGFGVITLGVCLVALSLLFEWTS